MNHVIIGMAMAGLFLALGVLTWRPVRQAARSVRRD